MGRCKVINQAWFEREDGHGYKVKEWAKKQSASEVYCILCMSIVSVENKGFQAISAHVKTKKHTQECAVKLPSRQLKLALVPPRDSNVEPAKQVKLFDISEASRAAELKWIMHCVTNSHSAKSCDGIGDLFRDIFPCDSANGFQLSRTKFRYVLNEALGPYFKEQMLKDLEGSYFSLMFDETTNVASQKQLSTMIRYWSESQQKILVHHLETFYMGSATADQIFDKLNEALANAGLTHNHLLMLGSDGPNVNKKVYRLMNEKIKLEFNKSLLSIGTCNLHVIHNTFAKGLEELGEDVSDLASSLHSFFDGWPSRKEDFEDVQKKMNVPQHNFTKHVQSRWLTLLGASERLLEQFPAVKEYFLKFVPKYRINTMKSNLFKKIVKYLDSETCKAQVLFVITSAKMFNPFLKYFQSETPLIQELYSRLNELVFLLANSVCKNGTLPTSYEDVNPDTCFEVNNLIPVESVYCGEAVTEELKSCSNRSCIDLKLRVRKHFISATKYLLAHIQGKSTTQLKDFRCLNRKERFAKSSCVEVVKVAKCLPLQMDYIALENEWRLLQLTKTNFDIELERDPKKKISIDKYWLQIFDILNDDGSHKFPLVIKTVKAAFSLSHGNSDVERNFSVSGQLMPEESSNMNQKTLNSLLTVRSFLKSHNLKPQNVFITKELLQLARIAGNSYKAYLDDEKKKVEQKETEKKKRKEAEEAAAEMKRKLEEEKKELDKKEEDLKLKKKQEDEEVKAASRLFNEAQLKLKQAIERKSFDDVRAANALLEGATAIQKQANLKRKAVDKVSSVISKKKNTLITKFLVKK